MPLYEFACRTCHKEFETLVTRDRPAVCPSCAGQDLEKLLSVFAVSAPSSSRHDLPACGAPSGGCGQCGDPRGPGACPVN